MYVATPVFEAIGDFIGSVWNTIKEVSSTVWNAIKSFLVGLWNGIVSVALIFQAYRRFYRFRVEYHQNRECCRLEWH
ncbi:hypothetical protein P7H17_25480 [Paenibacillus larvae]|nr:hypothetical protein [Paenibacillus larvae]MDT2288729.1 hypothetical protein [Paenibacillus larvae]